MVNYKMNYLKEGEQIKGKQRPKMARTAEPTKEFRTEERNSK
jgi:hypothetical protein